MKKTLSLVLAMVLMLSMANFAFAQERPTLTIGLKEDLAVVDWETNGMTKYIEDTLNVNLDFITFPSKEIGTKLNLMAMDNDGRDLPDILFHSASDNEINNWSKMGAIIPLTRYYEDEELSKNIRQAWERIGVDYRSQVTSPDGEIYTIPSFNQSYGNEQPMKIFIYKPFLDALNLEVPTTTDELYEVLKRVVNDDPNGNNKRDEIGISGTAIGSSSASSPSGWFETLMNAFVYAGDANYLTVDENGTLVPAYTTDAWKAGLEYIAKLYQEGLIQNETLTQDLASFKAVFNAEEPQVFMEVWYTAVGMLDGISPRTSEYIGIMPLKGPEGVQFVTYRPTVASNRMLITKNCEYPELAFRIGDMLSSELMSITTRWGEQGKDWDYVADMEDASAYEGMYEVAGFDKYIICYDDATFWSSGTPQNVAFRQQGPYVRQYAIANGQAKPAGSFRPEELMLAKMQFDLQTGGYNPKNVIPKLIYTQDENDVITEIKSTLLTYVREIASLVINGDVTTDDIWADYLNELKLIGVDTYVEVSQAVYDRMYK